MVMRGQRKVWKPKGFLFARDETFSPLIFDTLLDRERRQVERILETTSFPLSCRPIFLEETKKRLITYLVYVLVNLFPLQRG